jgi:hypothetical protein
LAVKHYALTIEMIKAISEQIERERGRIERELILSGVYALAEPSAQQGI